MPLAAGAEVPIAPPEARPRPVAFFEHPGQQLDAVKMRVLHYNPLKTPLAIIKDHRVAHGFACSLAVVLVAALFKGPAESDPSQPLGAAFRLTRGSPQRLESTDVVAHLGDDGAPVIAPIGALVDVPARVGTVASPDGGAPAVVSKAPEVAAPVSQSVDLPPVAYSLLASPGLQSRGRAPPSV